MFREFDVIFSDLFDKKQSFYKQLLLSLSTSCKSQAELSKLFPDISQSRISSALDDLEQAGFIRKDFTWNFGSSELSRLSKVSISDNYVQFYMRNVLPNKERISRGRYATIDLHQTRSWFQSMGYGFENIVLSNAQLVFSELGVTAQHVLHEGPYFQNKTARQAGCQVDYLIETESRNIFLCEIKYSSQPISNSVLEQVERTLRTIKTPKRCTVRPVLIHFGPITDKVKYAGLFEKIIDFSKFLQ